MHVEGPRLLFVPHNVWDLSTIGGKPHELSPHSDAPHGVSVREIGGCFAVL